LDNQVRIAQTNTHSDSARSVKKKAEFLCHLIKRPKMEWHDPIAMIVDDDDDLSFLLENILKTRNIKVLSAHNLNDAQDYLAQSKPDVVFLDNWFPDGFGVNFIRKIKSTGNDIKIIMMTSDPSAWVRKKAMEEGANYFLQKPFSKTTINQLLDQVHLNSQKSP
jgi:DNA-binding NtrC family response regulator